MDFEQGGSALAVFQEEYNAQQRAPPIVQHDRKMLYVHPLPHPSLSQSVLLIFPIGSNAGTSSLCKTAPAAKGLTSHLRQKTSSSSARTSSNRASYSPARTYASASSPIVTTRRRTTPTSRATLAFRRTLTRCIVTSRACTPLAGAMVQRRLLPAWRKRSRWSGGSKRAR